MHCILVGSPDGIFDSSSDDSLLSLDLDGIISVRMPSVNIPSSSDSSSDDDFFPLLASTREFALRAAPASTNSDSRVYDVEFDLASIPESVLNPNPIENMDSSSGDDYEVSIYL